MEHETQPSHDQVLERVGRISVIAKRWAAWRVARLKRRFVKSVSSQESLEIMGTTSYGRGMVDHDEQFYVDMRNRLDAGRQDPFTTDESRV